MKRLIILAILSAVITAAHAQLTVTLTGPTGSCETRIINTSVAGGSGTYMYIYSLDAGETGPPVASANVPSFTIDPQPLKTTTYRVVVVDLVSGATGTNTITFQQNTNLDPPVYMSNAITPNGDGVNDVWYVHNVNYLNDLTMPIGATQYQLQIVNSIGNYVLNTSGTNVNGLVTSQVYWNGRLHNAGARVPANATYFYTLTLYNCQYPSGKIYSGWIYVNY